ncbi:MAG: phosphoribosylpyrophosphate synthetase [Flavobacteriales bacterium]
MRYAYSTLSEAVDDLQRRGYTDDLQLAEHCVVCDGRGISLDPDAFEIDEFHRFEGNSDPEDQSVVYAISSKNGGIKGILVNAYGPDASSLTQEMVRKLATH